MDKGEGVGAPAQTTAQSFAKAPGFETRGMRQGIEPMTKPQVDFAHAEEPERVDLQPGQKVLTIAKTKGIDEAWTELGDEKILDPGVEPEEPDQAHAVRNESKPTQKEQQKQQKQQEQEEQRDPNEEQAEMIRKQQELIEKLMKQMEKLATENEQLMLQMQKVESTLGNSQERAEEKIVHLTRLEEHREAVAQRREQTNQEREGVIFDLHQKVNRLANVA